MADDEDDDDEEEEDEELEGEGRPHKQLAERLLESRVVLVADPISSDLAQDVISRLLLLDEQDAKAPIDIYVNSPGGSVDAGFAMYDMIRFISAPARCICTGLTASAAVVVLLAAPKKSRLSLPNSRFLIHQPSGGVRGSATDAKIEADEILKIRSKINQLIADETGQPMERVEEDTKRNYWMGAEEARKYGLITKVVKSRKEIG
ncbi:MAG: ATP-dependent Clp protease proteolytic subunit [Candidatus Brocadiaceae bacterium]|nr:ATP-dependent Clp protease proteolytic subunit [Candidatus Brocadiaceae bacterium]